MLSSLLPSFEAGDLAVSAGGTEGDLKLKGFEELEGVADEDEPKENAAVEADAAGSAGVAAIDPKKNQVPRGL